MAHHGTAASCQANAGMPSLKEGQTKLVLDSADPSAHCRDIDPKGLGGAPKILCLRRNGQIFEIANIHWSGSPERGWWQTAGALRPSKTRSCRNPSCSLWRNQSTSPGCQSSEVFRLETSGRCHANRRFINQCFKQAGFNTRLQIYSDGSGATVRCPRIRWT